MVVLVEEVVADAEGRLRIFIGGGWLSGKLGVDTDEEAREITKVGIGWCIFELLSFGKQNV